MKTDSVTYGLNIFFPRSQVLHPADAIMTSAQMLNMNVEGLADIGRNHNRDSQGDVSPGDASFFSSIPGHIVNDLAPWIAAIGKRTTPQEIILSAENATEHHRGKIHLHGSTMLGISHLRMIATSDSISTISLETDGQPAVILVDLVLHERSHLSLVSHLARGVMNAHHAVIIRALVNAEARLDLTTACFGSAYQYQRQAVLLRGEHARATSRTIALGNANDRLDIATEMIHNAPHTRSSQQSRTLLGDHAKAIVRGGITIPEGTPGADADLESRALLLSRAAEADLVPALVVRTDDVQCRHRASVSSPNASDMVYLLSRGISPDTATHMITTGFISPLITSPGGACVAPELEIPLRERLAEMTQEKPHD